MTLEKIELKCKKKTVLDKIPKVNVNLVQTRTIKAIYEDTTFFEKNNRADKLFDRLNEIPLKSPDFIDK